MIVSTDDEEIASVARECGAETPFLRPAELAQDQTTDLPVFEHALQWLKENEDYQPEITIQIRPTSPSSTSAHLRSGSCSNMTMQTVCVGSFPPGKIPSRCGAFPVRTNL